MSTVVLGLIFLATFVYWLAHRGDDKNAERDGREDPHTLA